MKKDWLHIKFADAFVLNMGKTPARAEASYWTDGIYPWVSISDLSGDKFVTHTKEQISQKAVDETNIHLVPKGTVIMSFKLSIGKTAIAPFDLYTNEAIMAFEPKPEISVVPDFLYYYLQYYKWSGNRAVMGETINKAVISNSYADIPPLSIQRSIVAELDLLHSVISKKKEQLRELDNLAQSLFYQMFGDPIANPMGWEKTYLKDKVQEMFLGPFGSALKVSCYVPQDESYCMVYEQKHAIKGSLNVETHYIDQQKFNELERFNVRGGDFIMSCRGTIGKIYQLPQDAPLGIIHPSLMKIRLKKDSFTPCFFLSLLSKIVANESTNGNCVQMAITAKDLGNKLIIYPPLSLQQSFAAKVSAIEAQKQAITQSIHHSEALLAQRMDTYFS